MLVTVAMWAPQIADAGGDFGFRGKHQFYLGDDYLQNALIFVTHRFKTCE